MNREEILENAIEKAQKNGWIPNETFTYWMKLSHGELKKALTRDIIFDPEWAKAFWGDRIICMGCHIEIEDTEWVGCEKCDNAFGMESHWVNNQHELLDLIQEGKDPIEYLEKFL